MVKAMMQFSYFWIISLKFYFKTTIFLDRNHQESESSESSTPTSEKLNAFSQVHLDDNSLDFFYNLHMFYFLANNDDKELQTLHHVSSYASQIYIQLWWQNRIFCIDTLSHFSSYKIWSPATDLQRYQHFYSRLYL